MRRSVAVVLGALVTAACAERSPEARAVDAIREHALAGWPYSDAQTVEQMRWMCRSLEHRSIAELLDSFAGQWSGGPTTEETQHDHGLLIRYSIEGVCPQHSPLIEDPGYVGHPGWAAVHYGGAERD
ncbi:hypothetical protein ACI797_15065 [Geodermatophilus sp. SYSU D00691]